MPRNQIDLEFGDGTYDFFLGLPQLEELQRKCGCGIGTLHQRLLKGCLQNAETKEFHLLPGLAEFYALDVIEPILQGLIGGNHGVVNGKEIEVSPTLAKKLLDAYVIGQPLVANWKIAFSIVGTCMTGYSPPKKAEPARKRALAKKGKPVSSTTDAH